MEESFFVFFCENAGWSKNKRTDTSKTILFDKGAEGKFTFMSSDNKNYFESLTITPAPILNDESTLFVSIVTGGE